ncbi:MAG: hypothetical protein HGB19_07815 [Chlorobiales bacterium]|jgi:lipopolysaccharide export system protein LptA|nr:hypothetical protein [Chlorobiales bacterium]
MPPDNENPFPANYGACKNMRLCRGIKSVLRPGLLFFLLVLPVWLGITPLALAQNTPTDTTQKKVYLEHADEIRGGQVTERPSRKLPTVTESIRSAIGKVLFVETTTTIECDTATEYLKSRKIRVAGNVKIVRDTVTVRGREGFYFPDFRRSELHKNVSLTDQKIILKSNHGTYFSDEQRGVFTGKVALTDGPNTVYSDSLVYFRPESRSVVIKRVRILNNEDNVTITGGYAEHFNDRQYSFIEQKPVLVKIDTSDTGQKDTLIIRAHRMEAFRNALDTARRIVMTDSVQIWRGNLTAKSKNAVYLIDEKKIILMGDPLVWYDETQASGDSMIVRIKENASGKNSIEKIFIYKNAFIASKDTANIAGKKFNQISGIDIVITFNDSSKIQRTDVYRQARSLYHMYDKQKPSGANYSTGDEITIFFENNSAARIKIKSGVEGEQYPEWMLQSRNPNLPGFRWRKSEKPTKPKLTKG